MKENGTKNPPFPIYSTPHAEQILLNGFCLAPVAPNSTATSTFQFEKFFIAAAANHSHSISVFKIVCLCCCCCCCCYRCRCYYLRVHTLFPLKILNDKIIEIFNDGKRLYNTYKQNITILTLVCLRAPGGRQQGGSMCKRCFAEGHHSKQTNRTHTYFIPGFTQSRRS